MIQKNYPSTFLKFYSGVGLLKLKTLLAVIFFLFMQLPFARAANQDSGKQDDSKNTDVIFESFEELAFLSMPPGWQGDFQTFTFGGYQSDQRLTRRIAIPGEQRVWETPAVALNDDPVFSFAYRVVDNTDYPDNATPAENFTIDVKVSTDGGSNFTTLETITEGNHTVSNAYVEKETDLSAYAGQSLIVRVEANHLAGDFWVDFDNVLIGAASPVSFLVTNGQQPIAGAAIDLGGLFTLFTAADGTAEGTLPAGTYSYEVSATNHLTLSDQELTVGDSDTQVPEIQLIGNYTADFTVTDQYGQPVENAQINITGNNSGYEDAPVDTDENISTNASGVASIDLIDGEYDYVVARQDHEEVTGSFTMNDAPHDENVTMQLYPMITFTIQEEDTENPVEDATITIEGYPAMTTGAGGQALLRLPPGSYNYTASKLGYLDNTASFTIPDMDDLELPVLFLTLAPPTFELLAPESGTLVFNETLAGQSTEYQSVTFRNAGTGTLEIAPGDITLGGDDATDFVVQPPSDPITLNTGEEATVEVAFAPQTSGDKTAVLQIEDNTAGKVLQTVNLTGSGYDATAVPFFEDFESGTFDNWFVVNGDQVNQWHVGTVTGDDANLSAIISNDEGVSNAYQTDGFGALSRVHFYIDAAIPEGDPGKQKISFRWKNFGENTDVLRIQIDNPDQQPVAESFYPSSIGTFHGETTWQTSTLDIPDAYLGTDARIVFSWYNNSSGGNQPPAAIDDIYIGELYDLTVDASPAYAGTAGTAATLGAGMPANLEANPLPGYVFDGWQAAEGVFEDADALQTQFTMPSQDVTITANFAVEPPVVQDLTTDYDGTLHTITATATEGFEVVWYDAPTGGNVIEELSSAQAGVYEAWVVARDDQGLESERVKATLTIEPFPLTITALDIDKEEGVLYTFTGDDYITDPDQLFATDEITSVTLSSDGADQDAEPGTYPIIVDNAQGSGLSNYAITYQNGIMTVTGDMVLTLSGLTAEDKEYDGTTTATITDWGTLEGIVDGAPDVQLETSNAVADFSQPEPGENLLVTVTGLQLTGEDAGEYLLGDATTTASITPRAITIAADDADKNYGDNDPELSWQVTQGSLISNNDLSGTLTRETGEDAGTYDILQGSLELPQGYDLTFQPGVFTIHPLPVTIAADDQSKVFGEDDPELTWQVTEGSLVDDDHASGNLTREQGETTGTYDILQGTLELTSNYALTFTGAELTITPRELTLSGLTAEDKEYDGTTTATITGWGTLEGIVDGASAVQLETSNAVADFSQPEPGEDLLVTVNGLQLTGEDAGEYLLGDATTTASITSRAITIAADDADKNYGDDDPELTWQVTQGSLISNNDLTGTLTRETGEDAGTYDILQGSLELPQGYDLTFQPGVFTIHPLPVTIAADDQSKVYGDNDPELTWQVTEGSLVDDDHVSGNLTREQGETTGTYDILQGTLELTSNYVLTFTGAALTITPRELTLTGTFTVEDKPFDGTTDANLTDYDLTPVGVLEGDEVQLANPEAAFTQTGVGEDITVVLTDVELQGTDAPNYEVSLEGAPTTTASITEVTYPLTVDITPEGSGTVTGEGDYLPGTAATLTATPNQGYRFRRWLDQQGITLSASETYNYTMTNSATTLTAEFEEETGVAEEDDMQLTLYPNPVKNSFTIRADAPMEQITISAVNGQVVYNRQAQHDEVKIAVEDYPAGIYFVNILTGERAWMKKIIIE